MPPAPADRLAGLDGDAREQALKAQQCLQHGDPFAAAGILDAALVRAPDHSELLRLRALAFLHAGRYAAAIDCLRRALSTRPRDALLVCQLGAAVAQGGDLAGAESLFRSATEWDPRLVDAWYNLGLALDARDEAGAARDAFARVLDIDPRHVPARIRYAQTLVVLGRLAEAEAAFRDVLRREPESIAAWIGLAGLKTWRPTDAELERVLGLHASSRLTETQRISLGFACASLLEARDRKPEAHAMIVAANAAKRRLVHWDAAAVSRMVSEILAAFDGAEPAHEDAARGAQAILIVGMPRSGSTLVEQILSAHPRVHGGGERNGIAQLLHEESLRRRQPFPQWARDAGDGDWTRLGHEYLARCAAWRGDRPMFTDKTLTNWQTLGAVRRMLPAAHIVHCRRDALETLWSCFKQHFGEAQDFSYDLDELVAFWRDCERAMRCWKARFPQWVHDHEHEALLREPEPRIRALLAHCNLEFDPACIAFHENARSVRTASSAQVREPLRADAMNAARLGPLLDALRQRIAVARFD